MSEAVEENEVFGVDVQKVQEWGGDGGPLLDPGQYVFEIKGAKKGNSSSTNRPVVKVQFEVVSDGPFLGAKKTKSYSLVPAALGRWKNLLLACRAPIDGTASTGHLIGQYITADVVHTTRTDAQPSMSGDAAEAKMNDDIVNEMPFDPPPEEEAQPAAAAVAPAPAVAPVAAATPAPTPAAAPAAAAQPAATPAARPSVARRTAAAKASN